MNKKLIILFTLCIITCIGCADVTNVESCITNEEDVYGFWSGVWHGMISEISFFGSLFSDEIAVYAINNNGAWYDFGFIGGLWIVLKLLGLVIENF